MTATCTIVIKGDFDPVPLVFEKVGPTVVIQPGESLRLVVTAPVGSDAPAGRGARQIVFVGDGFRR